VSIKLVRVVVVERVFFMWAFLPYTLRSNIHFLFVLTGCWIWHFSGILLGQKSVKGDLNRLA
jgi:hypothetical protein